MLAGVTVLTLLIGILPAARAAWVVTLLAGATLAGYVALLVRIRRQAEVRARMVPMVADGRRAGATGSGGWDEPEIDDPEALARSWADHPVNQVAVGGG